MGVKAVRELLRRNPSLAPERIGDVVFAATAQVGDQGLTLGRDVALLPGIPQSVPGLRTRPHVRRRADRGDRRRRRDRGGRRRRRPLRRRRAHGPPPDGRRGRLQPALRLGAADRRVGRGDGPDGREPARPLPGADEGATPTRSRSAPSSARRPRGRTASCARPSCRWQSSPTTAGASPTATSSCGPTPRSTGSPRCARRSAPGGRVTAGNSAGLTDGATAALLASEQAADELGLAARLRLVAFAYAGVEPHLMGHRPGAGDREGARAGGSLARRRRPLRAERAVRGAGADLVPRRSASTPRTSASTRTAARSPAAIRSPRPASG